MVPIFFDLLEKIGLRLGHNLEKWQQNQIDSDLGIMLCYKLACKSNIACN